MERGNYDLEYLGSKTDKLETVWHMYKVRIWNECNTKYDENCIYLDKQIDIKDISELDLCRLLYNTKKNRMVHIIERRKYTF